MNQLQTLFQPTWEWIKEDYHSHPFRFFIELLAWVVSVGSSVAMALTAPNPPLMYMYPVWISGCAMYGWASYTRRSFGMLSNYILLTTIDSIGLIRMILIA